MLLTEEQARKKWCCQHDMANQHCYASDCMAWRWGESEDECEDEVTLPVPKGESNPPFSNCPEGYKVERYSNSDYTAAKGRKITARGYCGLAGSPYR